VTTGSVSPLAQRVHGGAVVVSRSSLVVTGAFVPMIKTVAESIAATLFC
jgi:hypothetical protein